MKLNSSREIVRQHIGRISAEINAEHGTIFIITLPINSNYSNLI